MLLLLTGWGSIDYIKLAKLFSVVSTYNPPPINDDYTDDDLKTIIFYRKIALIIIIIISFSLCIYWTFLCYKKYFSHHFNRKHRYTSVEIVTSPINEDSTSNNIEFPTTTINVIHETISSSNQSNGINNDNKL